MVEFLTEVEEITSEENEQTILLINERKMISIAEIKLVGFNYGFHRYFGDMTIQFDL